MTLRPSRRTLLRLAALAPAVALPAPLRAELGAPESQAPRILRALRSASDAARFFACYSARRVFDAAARTNPAITPSTAERLVDALADMVATADDPAFADAAVVSLQAAGDSDSPPRIDGFPAAARAALADASRRRVIRIGTDAIDRPEQITPLLRAGVAAQEIARTGAQPSLREAVGYAGALLGVALERHEARVAGGAQAGVNEQSPDARLVAVAETILAIAAGRDADNGGTGIDIPEIRNMLIRGDRGVRTEILGLIGTGGRLTEPPYGFRPADLAAGR